MARRRLVEVFRACVPEPQAGEAISLGPLVGGELLERLEHDEYRGRPRLRVVGHPELEPNGEEGLRRRPTTDPLRGVLLIHPQPMAVCSRAPKRSAWAQAASTCRVS